MQQEILEKKPASTHQKPRLGFLGLGWIGRNRMEAIIEEECATVSYLAEPLEANMHLAIGKAHDAKQVRDYLEMLQQPELDAVVIATPSAQHASQAIMALEHGKAVFCQKPLGRNAGEVTAVVKAARDAGKLLGVDLSYRYTRGVQAIQPIISQGELGEIFAVDLVFHNSYGPDKPWFYDISQSGGGCLMDLGIHLIDLALWSLNHPEIVNVQSSLYYQGKKLNSFHEHAEDFVIATLTTHSGTVINLQCSWNLSAGQDAEISAKFYGTRGGVAFKNINGSFYDFVAEKYERTKKTLLSAPPDPWSGRAGIAWAKNLAQNAGFDEQAGREFIHTAEILDRIYGK